MFTGFPREARLREGLLEAYNALPSLQFLRTTYKGMPLLVLALACLGGAGAAALAERARAGLLQVRGRRLPAAALGVLAVIPLLAALPLVTGRAVDREQAYGSVPEWWTEATADAARDGGGRTMVLPGEMFGWYRWGGTMDPVGPGLAPRAAGGPRARPLRGSAVGLPSDRHRRPGAAGPPGARPARSAAEPHRSAPGAGAPRRCAPAQRGARPGSHRAGAGRPIRAAAPRRVRPHSLLSPGRRAGGPRRLPAGPDPLPRPGRPVRRTAGRRPGDRGRGRRRGRDRAGRPRSARLGPAAVPRGRRRPCDARGRGPRGRHPRAERLRAPPQLHRLTHPRQPRPHPHRRRGARPERLHLRRLSRARRSRPHGRGLLGPEAAGLSHRTGLVELSAVPPLRGDGRTPGHQLARGRERGRTPLVHGARAAATAAGAGDRGGAPERPARTHSVDMGVGQRRPRAPGPAGRWRQPRRARQPRAADATGAHRQDRREQGHPRRRRDHRAPDPWPPARATSTSGCPPRCRMRPAGSTSTAARWP